MTSGATWHTPAAPSAGFSGVEALRPVVLRGVDRRTDLGHMHLVGRGRPEQGHQPGLAHLRVPRDRAFLCRRDEFVPAVDPI